MMKPPDYRTIQRNWARLAALAVAALLAAPAASQVDITPAQPDPTDPDAVIVEELVVVGKEPGPAWWRVQDADTTVFVLGVPTVSPKGLAWDRAGLERRLDGANSLILGLSSAFRVNLTAIPGAAIAYLKVQSKKPYEDRLPPALKTRFATAREKIGRPAKRYDYDNGVVAGFVLLNDYNMAHGLTVADPGKTIRRLAQARKVKVVTLPLAAGGAIGTVTKADKAAQLSWTETVLAAVEAGPGGVKRAGEAWATGDVAGALAAERSMERTLTLMPGVLSLDARMKADRAKAIEEALKRPGHSVAVVELRPLLSQGGVLDRLRAKGFTVKTPAGT